MKRLTNTLLLRVSPFELIKGISMGEYAGLPSVLQFGLMRVLLSRTNTRSRLRSLMPDIVRAVTGPLASSDNIFTSSAGNSGISGLVAIR